MTQMQQFNLPDVGEGLTEAEIVSWKVEPGERVKVNDTVVEIETAKSLVELPSPYAGTVASLLVGEGETVAVGTPIIEIASESAPVEAATSPAPEPMPPATTTGTENGSITPAAANRPVEPGLDGGPAPGATPTLVGYGPRAESAARRPRRAVPQTRAAATAQADVNTAFSTADEPPPAIAPEDADEPAVSTVPVTSRTRARALAKPPVRKLAKDLGVDLLSVTPSGPGGVVTRDDVQAHAAPVAPAQAQARPAPADTDKETRVPVKGVRKLTAEAMVSSAFTAPHVTEWLTVDVSATMQLVDRLKADRTFADVRVSPLLVVAKAVCLALRRTPELNASWDEDAQEIVFRDYVNLGVAAATPRGLVVPNIRGAESKSLHEVAVALGELVATARDGRTQPEEMSGGTFTITNVGVFGVDAGTPILNPGESGILAFGAVNKRPWVVEGPGGDEVVPRWVTTLAVSFDHRVVDGEQGSRFLADVAGLLEDPARALSF